MAEEKQTDNPIIEEEKEGEHLQKVYKERGFQQQTFNEYLLLKKQQSERKKLRIPALIKVILTTPIILLFCLGLVFIPYIVFLFFTSG